MSFFDEVSAVLAQVNTATKYPKIDTYHRLDKSNGRLTDEVLVPFEPGLVYATEKIDGTNIRVIVLPGGGYLIGSREELVHAGGDLVYDAKDGTVDTVTRVAQFLSDRSREENFDLIEVYYFEVFGGRVTAAAKNYTSDPSKLSLRLLDIAYINPAHVLKTSVEQLSSQRKAGELYAFATEEELRRLSHACGVPLAPRVGIIDGSQLPTSVEGMYEYLRSVIRTTEVALDDGANNGVEGIVLRTPHGGYGQTIAKVRYQDYMRTLQPKGKRRR